MMMFSNTYELMKIMFSKKNYNKIFSNTKFETSISSQYPSQLDPEYHMFTPFF